MIYPSADKLENMGSKYALVVFAAKRAKQIKSGVQPLINTDSKNPLTIALEEIAAGKITCEVPDTDIIMAIAEEPEVAQLLAISEKVEEEELELETIEAETTLTLDEDISEDEDLDELENEEEEEEPYVLGLDEDEEDTEDIVEPDPDDELALDEKPKRKRKSKTDVEPDVDIDAVDEDIIIDEEDSSED